MKNFTVHNTDNDGYAVSNKVRGPSLGKHAFRVGRETPVDSVNLAETLPWGDVTVHDFSGQNSIVMNAVNATKGNGLDVAGSWVVNPDHHWSTRQQVSVAEGVRSVQINRTTLSPTSESFTLWTAGLSPRPGMVALDGIRAVSVRRRESVTSRTVERFTGFGRALFGWEIGPDSRSK